MQFDFLRGLLAAVVIVVSNSNVFAATFTFGSNANGLATRPTAINVTSAEFQMQLAAGPSGAGLAETLSPGGLGVASSAIAGVTGDEANVFGIIRSSDPTLDGRGEFIRFSFDRPGVLTGLDFDGVKDELLEFFVLESIGGQKWYFFDSSANMPDATHPLYERPLQAAIDAGVFSGQAIVLWEDAVLNDEVHDLAIPFQAGQEFTLTFGSLPAPYAQGQPNGARLQRIIVRPVPEPTAISLAAIAVLGGIAFRRAAARRRYFDAYRAMSCDVS